MPGVSEHHALSLDDLTQRLAVDLRLGLSAQEASVRLAADGPNALAPPPRRAAWRQLLDQFRNVLVAMLLVGAVVAGAVGDVKDAIAIGIVLLVNATLGYVQERRAASSLAGLRDLLEMQVRVRRDGRPHLVVADELVAGDVVLVEAGERIPADGRIVEAHAFEVDESALTGESVPTTKSSSVEVAAHTPLAERVNTAFLHTQVTKGRAVILVATTGADTEIGQIATMVAEEPDSPTPLQRQLDRLGRTLAAISGAVVGFYFLLGVLDGKGVSATLVSAVALLVAAIPEGLPAVVTLTLALGTSRLAAGGAIVKHLKSVETLGSATVVCSDKTGTLTVNEMTAVTIAMAGGSATVTGDGYNFAGSVDGSLDASALTDLARTAILCNDSHVRDGELVGDPTEGALIVLAHKLGLDSQIERAAWPRSSEVPFDSAHRVMVTAQHAAPGSDEPSGGDQSPAHSSLITVKGAWEEVAARSDRVRRADGSEVPLDVDTTAELESVAAGFAARGLRVLALADSVGGLPGNGEPLPDGGLPGNVGLLGDGDSPPDGGPAGGVTLDVSGLRLLGLVALTDPPRREAAGAVAECRAAGISVKMITGDHITTAGAIAEAVGIEGDALEGVELDRLDDETLAASIDSIAVFARVSPRHKMRIISALQARGHVVAMTGDGVNDAPALRAADIGVAMGQTGTEVAKDAADVVLVSDDFTTIAGAVREGRVIYDNIVKFVRFQLATNIGALLTIIVAELLNMPTPFSPIQLLWINLIMDGPPALALSVDPAATGVMRRPPRPPGAHILTRARLVRVCIVGAVMTVGSLGVLSYAQTQWGTPTALTMTFTTFVLYQVVNVLGVRDEFSTMFSRRLFHNAKLWIAIASVVVLQVLAVELPAFQKFFGTVSLSGGQWLLTIVVALSLVVVEELTLRIGHAPPDGME